MTDNEWTNAPWNPVNILYEDKDVDSWPKPSALLDAAEAKWGKVLPFKSTLGMCEMETAFHRLCDLAVAKHGDSWKFFVSWEDFPEKVGFCQLLARGQLAPAYPNACFMITRELVEHVAKRLGVPVKEEPCSTSG